MIYAVVGQTGSGKSGFVLRKIERWIVERDRALVVTNLALDVPEFCEYLNETYGETFDAAERIQILDLEQVACFWRFFGRGYTIPEERSVVIPMGDGEQRECQDFSGREKAGHSVLYALDESDEIFDAKRWAKIVHDLKFYTRHQRKFGDDVYFLAPAWDFLVKELRLQIHAVWTMENQAQMKLGRIPFIGSLFRNFARIKARQYKVRQGGAWGGLNELPRDETSYRVDPKGIDRTYRTEDGLGVKGLGSIVRKAEKAKGLSPVWIGVGVAACICAIPFVLKGISYAIGSSVRTVTASTAAGAGITNTVSSSTVIQSPIAKRNTEMPAKRNTEMPAQLSYEVKPYCTGVVWDGKGAWIFYLSDGSTRASTQPDFLGLVRDSSGKVVGGKFVNEMFRFDKTRGGQDRLRNAPQSLPYQPADYSGAQGNAVDIDYRAWFLNRPNGS